MTEEEQLLCDALAQIAAYDEKRKEWDTMALSVAADIADYLEQRGLVAIHAGFGRRLLFRFSGEAAEEYSRDE